MAKNENLDETLEAWADIVLRLWEERIKRLKIGDTNQLLQSLNQHVYRESGGDPDRVDFTFEYYGKFVDMGVRKGVSLASGRTNPKPWYSKTFYSQVKRLGDILQEKYAQRAAIAIVENLDDNALNSEDKHHKV